MTNVKEIFAQVKALSYSDKSNLMSMLSTLLSLGGVDTHEYMEEKRFSKGIVCPHCHSHNYVRNGHRKDGSQRFVCKDCGKSFVSTTNTILDYTKKEFSVWNKYIECMISGKSLRDSADICGIHRNTAFLWRHKILDALQKWADRKSLEGIVEADETFFSVSYKGNHKNGSFTMPRKAHHRGSEVHTRGLSHEKVCVPCAVSRDGVQGVGNAIAKSTNLGRVTTKAITSLFGEKISKNSMLVTDEASAYKHFAKCFGIDLIQLNSKGKRVHGIYHIQHINSFHSLLKGFMSTFKGVATKYLNNYLVWFNFTCYMNGEKSDMASEVFVPNNIIRRANISCRPVLPF